MKSINHIYLLFTILLFGCSSKMDYDFSRVKVALDYFYEALEPEMFYGNELSEEIFYINSKHHRNIIFVSGIVYYQPQNYFALINNKLNPPNRNLK